MTSSNGRGRPLRKSATPVRGNRAFTVVRGGGFKAARVGVRTEAPRRDLLDGTEFGRVGALAGAGARDLAQVAAKFPGLFPRRPFDPAMFGAVALAGASSAPWLDHTRICLVNRMSLWLFGLDLRAEAMGPTEVDALVRRCHRVADGGDPEPGDELTELLAVVRAELAGAAPAGTARLAVWRDALGRTLAAVAREQAWLAALRSTQQAQPGQPRPGPEEYLDNAASTGFSVVFSTLWLTETTAAQAYMAPALAGAVAAAERVLRLVNDLGGYDRDVAADDLNVLRLGLTRAELAGQIEESTDRMMTLLHSVRLDQPRLASYVERQVGYAMGLYGVGDFWGPQ